MANHETRAYILHVRPYRETSCLIDALTDQGERIHLISRGGRKRFGGLMQPFNQLFLHWQQRSNLGTLKSLEAEGPPIFLNGDALSCGLYLNELLTRALKEADPHPELYELYHATLNALSGLETLEQIEAYLRCFELHLLSSLGYGVDLSTDSLDRLIDPALFYTYQQDRGLSPCQSRSTNTFQGRSLIALASGPNTLMNTPEARRDAKRLLRTLLAPILGDKPLRSRALFV